MSVANSANPLFFCWENLGDLEIGRPNLGGSAPVLVYRLMQYALKAVLAQKLGVAATKEIFRQAGRLAGAEFCRNVLDTSLPLDRFLLELGNKLAEWKIGVLQIEDIEPDTLEMTLTVAEDLDCSGLHVCEQTLCDYDEGFLAGILSSYTGQEFHVEEISCWALGDRTCRFKVTMVPPA
ncbi:MAG: V4R domain-containing protein [Desulfobacca sp.]|uniref:V4R domain-containing protein n=1 Tax=Desulfobacca sp. TaxID=2067990 RepID=UPI00404B4E14